MKSFISLLLVLTVTAGLFVTSDLSVFAAKEPARGNDIYAMLYQYVDSSGVTSGSLYELVFQKGNVIDQNKNHVKTYSEFADTFINDNGRCKEAAWKDYRSSIKRVDFRDKIAPTSIDGWFYGMTKLKNSELLHLENLDTSSCKYMRYTFAESGVDTLDLRSFDVSNVERAYATFYR